MHCQLSTDVCNLLVLQMSYEKYTNQLNSLKGRLTSLEAEMRAEYDRIQTEILPAMQNALKGHRAQLEAKRNTAKAILKGIRDDLHEIEWAIKQAQSRYAPPLLGCICGGNATTCIHYGRVF